MARDSRNALVALNRFGFGARGGATGDFVNAASDPRGFVKADLASPSAVLLEAPELKSTPELANALFQHDAEQAREAAARNAAARQAAANGGSNSTMAPQDTMQPKAAPSLSIDAKTYNAEALARLQRAVMADCGFAERLVVFWSNHFCISGNKDRMMRQLAGSFEREAIRPHVLGRFADMLKAVEQHTAMLFYLDNGVSVGPNSPVGLKGYRGLNENLAREIMELHTLSVNGGYTQDDVISLARVITGWTYSGIKGILGPPGSFVFYADAHEPGAQRVLGKVYEENGVAQGEAVLADIARHPSTAKFIATKFARHFVADDPPPALVAKLQDVFIKTDGDLHLLANTLIDADEAWTAPMSKIRSPYEYLVAISRARDRAPESPYRHLGALSLLGQDLWSPTGPDGFADTNIVWAAPWGMKLRLDIAAEVSSMTANGLPPRELLERVAGDAASEETRRTIERAESPQRAMTLLFMSPEFQRR
jgi:uncharacterized protein (DUF1800 family)